MKKLKINKGLIGTAIVVAIFFLLLMLASCSSSRTISKAGSEHKYIQQPDNGRTFNHIAID